MKHINNENVQEMSWHFLHQQTEGGGSGAPRRELVICGKSYIVGLRLPFFMGYG